LVGLATVPATGEGWLDRFLQLPDEALAVLRCRLQAPEAAVQGLRVSSGDDAAGWKA